MYLISFTFDHPVFSQNAIYVSNCISRQINDVETVNCPHVSLPGARLPTTGQLNQVDQSWALSST